MGDGGRGIGASGSELIFGGMILTVFRNWWIKGPPGRSASVEGTTC